MKKFLLLLFTVLPLFSLVAQQKYALVIGNGNYTNTTKLDNPVNDANDMTTTLQELGFTVDKILNGTQDQMVNAIIRLKNRLSVSKNSYGFFFYAGHGIQSNGENYLIPVDANIPTENFLRNRTVSVQEMLDELNDAGNELNVVVLDACRDNPFSWKRSSTRGLNIVSHQPADSIIVYATSAGSTAADGIGRNGLFTSQLLSNLKTPDLEITEMLRRTGADVARVSDNQQRPAVYNQFYGTAYLGSKPAQGTTTIATENIYLFETLDQFTYSLSNSLDEIEKIIYIRTGKNVKFDNVNWSLNTTNLSPKVKALMNKHNVNYSMTIYSNSVIVNKRVGNEWYFLSLNLDVF